MKQYNKSIFIFRRDLRLNDNTALIRALSESESVIPVFCFDPRQVSDNEYKSDPAIQFMLSALKDLNSALNNFKSKLYCFYGEVEKEIEKIATQEDIEAIYLNRDYTPFAQERDRTIKAFCDQLSIAFHEFDDLLLASPGSVVKGDKSPYVVFTPFYKAALKQSVRDPVANDFSNYYQSEIEGMQNIDQIQIDYQKSPNLFSNGTRSEALKLVERISDLNEYDQGRDQLSLAATSYLSPFLKFGLVSAREVYQQVKKVFGKEHSLIKELYWRDFFTSISFFFPHVYTGCFHKKYDKIKWSKSKKNFQAWCDGMTGFPIIDAGMRQLNQTGYMHNRARMIVASFLVKDLQINWRWGEKYFAQKLVDYDPAVNNGNWQWAASTGCDAQPYFRIFNPWLQQEKFDTDCEYIKKWVPELSSCSSKEIHNIGKGKLIESYLAPIVDHAEAKEITLDMYDEI